MCLKEQGKLDEAVACYRRALELKPDYAEAHNNLGVALKDQGKLDEAVACYRRALELKPDYAEAHNNLGNALKEQGKLDEAIACYRRALELKPDYAEAHNNLGIAFKDQGKLDEAVACYRRALELKPDYAEAHNNLGVAFKDQGKLDEAVACYRRALELKPDFAEAHSNLVYTQLFCPGCDAQTLYEEHRRWNRQHAAPLAKFIQPHGNDRSPDRRLRVGYVSPDFRNHCQAFFTVPLFSAHDHQNFEIVCYADVVRPDDITARLRGYADAWRNITGLNHEQVAQLDSPGRDRHPRGPDDAHGPQSSPGLRPQTGPRAGLLAGLSRHHGPFDHRLPHHRSLPGSAGPLTTAATRRNPSACRTPSGATIRWTASRQSTPCRPRRRGISRSGASTTSARSTRWS